MDWQPIETAPAERAILVSDGRTVCEAEFDLEDWWARCGTLALWDGDFGALELNFDPTHWMPLPAPPRDSDTHPNDGDAQQGSARE